MTPPDLLPDLDSRCRRLMAELGLGRDVAQVVALSGGVASDIAMVDLGHTRLCAKFALPKLRVAADWFAPVHRNAAEYAWLESAARVVPGNVPRLYGRSARLQGFAMEYLDGAGIYLWKTALLSGAVARGEAAAVGDVLGRIHAASAVAGFDKGPFRNRDDFRALRLEPYLSFTAGRHPDLAGALGALERALYLADQVLVHGDVSPKNILIRGGAPVLLDAECATMGDASFDVAFCLNHLVLKAVHMPAQRGVLLAAGVEFWAAYRGHVGWEDPDGLERRVAALLPALMLARVDGKSPVDYLDQAAQVQVRRLARRLIAAPAPTLVAIMATIAEGVTG